MGNLSSAHFVSVFLPENDRKVDSLVKISDWNEHISLHLEQIRLIFGMETLTNVVELRASIERQCFEEILSRKIKREYEEDEKKEKISNKRRGERAAREENMITIDD